MKIKKLKEDIAEYRSTLLELDEKANKDNRLFTDDEKRSWEETEKKLTEAKEALKKEERAEELRKEAALEAKQEEEKRSKEEGGEDKEAKVGESRKKDKGARDLYTVRMLQGIANNDIDAVKVAQRSLVEGGHIEQRDGYSTFKDDKGGVFIPTSVSNEIFEFTQQYGVIPQNANRFTTSGERIRVPSIIGRPAFSAVGEGNAIAGSGSTFGGILLDVYKWGMIVDWTSEIGDAAGSRILPIVQRKVAEALAFLYDDTAFNADGTSSYHGIQGYEFLSTVTAKNYVKKTSAASGRTSYGALKAEDYNAVKYDVSPSARGRGIYVMHPDMEEHILNLKDDNGQFIYGGPNTASAIPRLWGRPLFFSEAFTYDDGADKALALYFDPSYLAYGSGDGLMVKRLTEATITNEDGTSVNLATQDAEALRFLAHFDMVISDLTNTSGGVTRGSAAVLYTAAS